MPTSQALVLTNDEKLDESIGKILDQCRFTTNVESSIRNAWMRIEASGPDLLLADLDGNAAATLVFLEELREAGFPGRVIVLAGPDFMEHAQDALGKGATAYLKKPVEPWELEHTLNRIAADGRRNEHTASVSSKVYGSSPSIQAVLKLVDQVARRDDHLLVLGEPGSGKRLIGRLIHSKSHRSGAGFASLSCAGLSESLLELELFGGRDGRSSTGTGRKGGCIETCDHGTLLLDEIGDLPRRLQEGLLRRMDRSGSAAAGSGTHDADFRIIGTSSHDLEERVEAGRFLRELLDRLQGIRISVPPLRSRRSDIPVLVDQYVRLASVADGSAPSGVSSSALRRLMQYDWPGNVCELKDIVTRAVARTRGRRLEDEDLPAFPDPVGAIPNAMIPGATIQEIERDAILRTIQAAGGSTSRAARILDISVRKIQYKLKEYREDAASISAVEAVQSRTVRTGATVKKHRSSKKAVFSVRKNPTH